jgi:diaminopimelate decarboxylase
MQLKPSVAQALTRITLGRELPFYWYDSDQITAQCRRFGEIPYAPKSVHFATMANANPDFLRLTRAAGINVFVNSLGHLQIAQYVGYSGRDIVFTSSGMSDALMSSVRSAGAVLNLDSVGQLRRFWKLFPDFPVGLRCNIGDRVTPRKTHSGYFLGRDSRLGLDLPELEELAGNPHIEGLHLYLGTDIMDLAYYKECYEVMADLATLFPNLVYLDFGGGFGVEDSDGDHFPMEEYGALVTDVMNRLSSRMGRPVQLLLEPGRIIGAEAGYLVVRVTDVKLRHGRQLVGVNASSAQFTRPLLYPDDAWHPVFRLSGQDGPLMDSSVYGCSTYSRDFLAHDIRLPKVEEDEWLVLSLAGSYCASSFTRFLGFEQIEEIFS